MSLTTLHTPPNTRVFWSLTSDRVLGRNSVIRQALDAGCEWVLFCDDDHVIGYDLLNRLLARNVDVVGALYLQRMQPFGPIAYSHRNDEGAYIPLRLTEFLGDELVPVEGIGTGALLVRSEVFRAIGEPWFEHHTTASEDLVFCQKCRAADIPVHVDLAARIGHLSPSAVWPDFTDDEWRICFDVSDGCRLQVPVMEAAAA